MKVYYDTERDVLLLKIKAPNIYITYHSKTTVYFRYIPFKKNLTYVGRL